MKRKLTPEGKLIVDARKAAVIELGKPVDDALVKQFAPLLVAHDLIQVRIASGDTKAIDALIRLDAAMTDLRKLAGADKPIEEPTHHTVSIELVEPKDGAISPMPCRRCGWRHGDDITPMSAPAVSVTPPEASGEPRSDVQPAAAAPALPRDNSAVPAKPLPDDQQPGGNDIGRWLGGFAGPSHGSAFSANDPRRR